MKTRTKTRKLILMVLTILISFFYNYGQSDLPVSKHYKLEKIADGVYAAIHNDNGGYAICNAGIVDLGDKTIVIDPFISPEAARDLKKHAESLTGRSVSYVINLDPHNDHTRGNQVFIPDADIIGTSNTRNFILNNFDKQVENEKIVSPQQITSIEKELKEASIEEQAELKMWLGYHKAKVESFPELKMTPPNITIDDTMTIYGSERSIVIIPTGTGHTTGDMVAFFPKEKIIFMGDQLFVNHHPFIGHGDPESWINNLKGLTGLGPEIAVPGHGPVSDINSFYPLIDYLETLTKMVSQEIEKGTDESKVADLPLPERFNDWWFGLFYSKNLKFLYNKLKNESTKEL